MARRLLPWLLIALATGVASAACGAKDAASPRATPTTTQSEARVSVPGLPTVATASTTAPRAPFEFVDYRVSGGSTGRRDHLKVYPDGRATYDEGGQVREFSVPAGTVTELRAALEQADLASLPRVSGTPTADVHQYNVIFGGWSVRFVDGAMPERLAPAVAILNRELARGKAGR